MLVVGATGALRPAALRLAAAGEHVVAVARDPGRLAVLAAEADGAFTTVAVDFRDDTALTRQLGRATAGALFDAALLYCPTAPSSAVERFAAAVAGRVVEIVTSEAARPAAVKDFVLVPSTDPRRRTLVLGWTTGSRGTRWHTPDEISAAALIVLETGAERVVGRVRPWSDRPA